MKKAICFATEVQILLPAGEDLIKATRSEVLTAPVDFQIYFFIFLSDFTVHFPINKLINIHRKL